jgi:hypothetical protein
VKRFLGIPWRMPGRALLACAGIAGRACHAVACCWTLLACITTAACSSFDHLLLWRDTDLPDCQVPTHGCPPLQSVWEGVWWVLNPPLPQRREVFTFKAAKLAKLAQLARLARRMPILCNQLPQSYTTPNSVDSFSYRHFPYLREKSIFYVHCVCI